MPILESVCVFLSMASHDTSVFDLRHVFVLSRTTKIKERGEKDRCLFSAIVQ